MLWKNRTLTVLVALFFLLNVGAVAPRNWKRPAELDYFVAPQCLPQIAKALGDPPVDRATLELIFEEYVTKLNDVDVLATAANNAAGRKQLKEMWEDPSQRQLTDFRARADELQAAWIAKSVEFRARGDALVDAFLDDVKALCDSRQASVLERTVRDLIRVESYREAKNRDAVGVSRYPITDWIDVLGHMEDARAETKEVYHAEKKDEQAKVTSQDKAAERIPLAVALEQVAARYRDEILRVATETAAVMRTPLKKGWSSVGTDNESALRRNRALLEGRLLAAKRAIDAVAHELEARGFEIEKKEWLSRCWSTASEPVFLRMGWTRDWAQWLAARKDVDPAVVELVQSETEVYKDGLLRLRLDAIEQAIEFKLTSEQDSLSRVRKNFAKTLAAIWRHHAEHVNRVRAKLSGDALADFEEAIGAESLGDGSRMPVFDEEMLQWLRENNMLPR